MQSLITLTSDFGVQTQGIGTMEATAFAIAPHAKLIHLMHGLPEFNIIAAARTLESLRYCPVGFHVCVCDPGVGTDRKALAVQVRRSDYLIGPDNGVLLPAARVLGGAVRAHKITNEKFMRQPVSPIFHGRDIFTPAAAHLANGVRIEELGPEVPLLDLYTAPYNEAVREKNFIRAQVIQINRFGSLHLNILHETWDTLGFEHGQIIKVESKKHGIIELTYGSTFGDVPEGSNVIMRDDYGRVEIAKNLGRFVDGFPIKIGDTVEIILS